MLRSWGGNPSRSKDGLLKLVDGKKTVLALKRCLQKYLDDAQRDLYSWTPKLVDHLENGVEFTEGEIENDDDCTIKNASKCL